MRAPLLIQYAGGPSVEGLCEMLSDIEVSLALERCIFLGRQSFTPTSEMACGAALE